MREGEYLWSYIITANDVQQIDVLGRYEVLDTDSERCVG